MESGISGNLTDSYPNALAMGHSTSRQANTTQRSRTMFISGEWHESRRALMLGIPKFAPSRPIKKRDKTRKVVCGCGGNMSAVSKYSNAIEYRCDSCNGTCMDIDIEAGSTTCRFAEGATNV